MTFIERDALSMVMWFSLSAVRWFPRLRSRVVPAGRPRGTPTGHLQEDLMSVDTVAWPFYALTNGPGCIRRPRPRSTPEHRADRARSGAR